MEGRDDCVDLLVEKKANVNALRASAGALRVSAGPRDSDAPRLCSARAAAAAPLAD